MLKSEKMAFYRGNMDIIKTDTNFNTCKMYRFIRQSQYL